MMYFDDDPLADPVPDDWDSMLHTLDDADHFQDFDVPEEPSYAILRIIFKSERPGWERLDATRPQDFYAGDDDPDSRSFSYTSPDHDSILLWDDPEERTLDVVSWTAPDHTGHSSSHPESRAVEWLQSRRNADPNFGENVSRVKLLIQDKPCRTCLEGLRSSLGQVLPAGSGADIRWVRPNPRKQFRFFQERRYKPKINRWDRD